MPADTCMKRISSSSPLNTSQERRPGGAGGVFVVPVGDNLVIRSDRWCGRSDPLRRFECAVGDVEEERVGVELVDSDGDAGFGGGQSIMARSRLAFCEASQCLVAAFRSASSLAFLASLMMVFTTALALRMTSPVMSSSQRVPSQVHQAPEFGDVVEVLAVTVDESVGVAEV